MVNSRRFDNYLYALILGGYCVAQRVALDQWFNGPSLDHADQWSDESLSRVDLIGHWSENEFARKERHRSKILIRIFPKERTQSQRFLAQPNTA